MVPRRVSDLVWLMHAGVGVRGVSGAERVEDLSGRGNVLTEATNPPSLSSVGGKPTLSFDGTNDRLRNTSLTGVAAGASLSLYMAFKRTNTAASHCPIETTGTASTLDGGMLIFGNAAVSTIYRVTGGPALEVTGAADASAHVAEIHLRHGVQMEALLDGVSVGVDSVPTPPAIAAQIEMTVGVRTNGTSNFLSGDVFGGCLYARELVGKERIEVRRWWGRQAGVSVTL